ncbi:MAG: hypothetical protein JSU74_06895, partial [Candidatus Zixiibacteriota bacterium]
MRAVILLCLVLGLIGFVSTQAADITTAIDSGYVDQVTDILREKPDLLNLKDSDALTPLNRASFKGQTEIVKLLLEMGADVSIGDNENSQP